MEISCLDIHAGGEDRERERKTERDRERQRETERDRKIERDFTLSQRGKVITIITCMNVHDYMYIINVITSHEAILIQKADISTPLKQPSTVV